MDEIVTIPITKKIRDELISRNTANKTFSQIIEDMLRKTENTISFDTCPEIFDDYDQIQQYYSKFQSEVNRHNRLGIDRVSVRIFTEKPYGCIDVFYNKDSIGKFKRSRV